MNKWIFFCLPFSFSEYYNLEKKGPKISGSLALQMKEELKIYLKGGGRRINTDL